ncbi:phosphoglycerate kinase [Candidatus Falkowbacteria bacterium RIFOXYB2_FULL_35_7]|uniref:Phosphoglycerate kinase n=1 Tax=Candidatus Falkowbacteria bacterium RIFOXYC2_FULL_36_12 TaxID=1798002 RepID=A0A1F5SY85_9BACT|nr:MAG: phosphoglycerate kinase [Candidatus Falkowbacteria bacterium RIFOXYC2_FULL_36_12]OGF31998.1 MAG: phosphoglycerate kinase [Candidatus Falkowbacteria bacterium RIFOXYB2_FULL_35_7]
MKLYSIKDVKDLKGKKVFLRVDWNVAMKNNKILEPYRIERTIPTIKYLLRRNCQLIIASHLGRPEGRRQKKYSLAPIVRVLKKDLPGQAIKFVTDRLNESTARSIKHSSIKIIVLENLRFDEAEEKNSRRFAELLASMADIYVNDAFAVCHRKAASVSAITKCLPSFSGLNMDQEVDFLSRAINQKSYAVAIIGGIKIDSKFPVVEALSSKYSSVLVAGGVGNLFLKAAGADIGASVCDDRFLRRAKVLLKRRTILYPIDYIVSDKKKMTQSRYHKLSWDSQIASKNEMILDIGPETIRRYINALQGARLIVWGGPVGNTELKDFSRGTKILAKFVASRSRKKNVTTIIGGGETIAAFGQFGLKDKIDFISTGGGAMLEFLEGIILPGIKPLIKNK